MIARGGPRTKLHLFKMEGAEISPACSATPESPWINVKPEDGPPPNDDETRKTFLKVLQSGLTGARLNTAGQPANLYLIFGYASQGYGDMDEGWPLVEKVLEEWCQRNDERHKEAGTGWILMTQGDGDYGKKSIESIARYVRYREPPTPVVFIQSDFGYAAPGSAYWPAYASAGYFGPGLHHQKVKLDKEGNERTNKDGSPMLTEAWGGYVKARDGTLTGELGFPDDAIMTQHFGGEALRDHLGGIFVAGGGDITFEQAALYRLRQAGRPGDCYVAALAGDGSESKLSSILAPGYREEAEEAEAKGTGLCVAMDPPLGAPVLITSGDSKRGCCADM